MIFRHLDNTLETLTKITKSGNTLILVRTTGKPITYTLKNESDTSKLLEHLTLVLTNSNIVTELSIQNFIHNSDVKQQ